MHFPVKTKQAIIRTAVKRVEEETPLYWAAYPQLSKDIVRIVLEVVQETAAA